MTRGQAARGSNWPTVLGIGAIVIVVVAIAIVFSNRGGSPSSDVTQQVSPTTQVQASATLDLVSVKATIQAAIQQTAAAVPFTPPVPGSLATATQDTRPMPTPNFPEATPAGAGVIVFHPPIPGNWGRVAINMWVELSTDLVVYAGGTDDPAQGAVFVLLPGENIDHPETYLTPLTVGLIQVVDAQNERIVLKSLVGDNTFYFDVPTRQFVDSLSVTSVAPTVTPLPTEAATPTMEMPTNAPPPTAYPIASPSEATPAPTSQSTASP
jgi:hypothetical protein